MKKLKTIDTAEGTYFVANGKKYYIESSMSVGRYAYFEKIETELGFGRSFAEIIDALKGAMTDINSQKQGEAYVKLSNLIRGIAHMNIKKPHVFRYCALFINSEDEDRSTISEDLINAKFTDWEKEGLDHEPFFSFALNSLPGFRERYTSLIQNTSAGRK
ncbi:MAG: hypothetical protein ACTHLE_04135 [Agriterribacter sp.]